MNKKVRKLVALALALIVTLGSIGMTAAEGVSTPSDLPPMPTEAPVVIAEPTPVPEATEAPVEEAEPTAVPEVTEAPATEAPVEEAEPTAAPEVTEAPATEAPIEEAEPTAAPEVTEVPATEAPVEEAEPTAAPEVTEAPATEAPVEEVEPTAVPEITEAPAEPETVSLVATLVWEDSGNAKGIRPETVAVFAIGSDDSRHAEFAMDRPLPGESGEVRHDVWTQEFHNLPKMAGDTVLEYRVSVTIPEGYRIQIEGLTIHLYPNEEEPPVEETEAPEITEAPVEETEAPEITEAPVEETEVPEVTEAPVEETEAPEVTEAPVEETEVPEITEAPVEETEAPEITEAPAEETEAPEIIEAPVEETEAPEVTEAPAEPTEVSEITEAPVEETEAPAVEAPAPVASEAPVAEAEAPEAPAPTNEPAPTEKPAAEQNVRIAVNADTDIRLKADGLSEIILTIPAGTTITVLGIEGDWARVKANGVIGYIYKDSINEWDQLKPETEENEECPIKATIFSSRRAVMEAGETVYLTSKLEGTEGYDILLQWQCDKGNGFEDVPGANEDHHSFEASIETLSYNWRLVVYYR